MFGDRHELHTEFPEHAELIRQLHRSDEAFAALLADGLVAAGSSGPSPPPAFRAGRLPSGPLGRSLERRSRGARHHRPRNPSRRTHAR